jgi:hypothetical protein
MAGTNRLFGVKQGETLAVAGDDEGYYDPKRGGVEGVPRGFLGGGDVGRAEDDEGAGGDGVEELGEENTICVGVGPGDEDADGGHGGGEGKKEGEPVGAVGGGGSEVVNDGDVPGAPEKAEKDGGSEGVAGAAHFWEGEAHPSDFFEEAGGEAERGADEKVVGGKDGRHESIYGDQNAQDDGRREEKRGEPASGEADATHAREKIAQATGAVHDAGQDDADDAGPEEHGRKHHQAGEFWDRLAAEEMRKSHGQCAQPGDGEGQHKISGDGMAGDESLVFGREWCL